MKVLICDDDVSYARKIKHHVKYMAQKFHVDVTVDTVESGSKLLFFLNSKYAETDLIYMDYHMPGKNGLETARELRQNGVVADIVFCTMDSTHAIEAYDVGAMNYIVKEQTDELRLEKIFLDAVHRARHREADIITLSCAGDHRHIALDNLLYFEVQKHIVRAHYYVGERLESFEFYSTLSKLEEALGKKGFRRIHASYLVNERHIVQESKTEVSMPNGVVLPIGKSYRAAIGGGRTRVALAGYVRMPEKQPVNM